MRAPKVYADQYEVFLKCESKHATDRRGVSGSPGQRDTYSIEFNSFPSCEFRNETNGNGFHGRSTKFGSGRVEINFKTVVIMVIIVEATELILEESLEMIV